MIDQSIYIYSYYALRFLTRFFWATLLLKRHQYTASHYSHTTVLSKQVLLPERRKKKHQHLHYSVTPLNKRKSRNPIFLALWGGELIGLGGGPLWSGLTAKFPNIPTIYHTR